MSDYTRGSVRDYGRDYGRDYMRRPLSLRSNMPVAPMPQSEAQALIERVVKMSKADSISMQIDDGTTTNLRFADNRVSTAGQVQDSGVVVISSFGPKHAAVQTNDLSDEGLRRAVAQSEALARLAPDDPEAMPPLGPQQYKSSEAYFTSTAEASADERARAAMTALEPSRAAGDLKAAGYLEIRARATAIGNSKGMFGYHPFTTANYTLTVRTTDGTGSGWAGAEVNDWSGLDFAALGKRAADKARASRSPVAVEPGRYTVVIAQSELEKIQATAARGDNAEHLRLINKFAFGALNKVRANVTHQNIGEAVTTRDAIRALFVNDVPRRAVGEAFASIDGEAFSPFHSVVSHIIAAMNYDAIEETPEAQAAWLAQKRNQEFLNVLIAAAIGTMNSEYGIKYADTDRIIKDLQATQEGFLARGMGVLGLGQGELRAVVAQASTFLKISNPTEAQTTEMRDAVAASLGSAA